MLALLQAVLTTPAAWAYGLAAAGIGGVLAGVLSARDRRAT